VGIAQEAAPARNAFQEALRSPRESKEEILKSADFAISPFARIGRQLRNARLQCRLALDYKYPWLMEY